MDKVLFYCPGNSLSKNLSNDIGFINIGSLVKKLTGTNNLIFLSCQAFYNKLYVNFKDCMKRRAVGIWACKSCRKVVAGGAWVYR